MLGGSPGWWDRVEGKPAIVMEQKYYVSHRGDPNTLPGKTHELKEVAWDSKKAGPASSCWERLKTYNDPIPYSLYSSSLMGIKVDSSTSSSVNPPYHSVKWQLLFLKL